MSNQLFVATEQLMEEVRKCINEGKTVTIRARGFSMRPFIEDKRDLLRLSPITRPLKIGDVLLTKTNLGKFVLHRIVGIEDEFYILRGDGNVGVERVDKSESIAILTACIRKGRKKEEKMTSMKWRIYSFLWTRTLKIRPYLLAIYKRIFLR